MNGRRHSLTVALVLLLVTASRVRAEDIDAKLARLEREARESVAGELHRLGLQAVGAKAVAEARVDFALGLSLCPGDRRLREALEKLGEDPGVPRPSFLRTYAVKRKGAYLRAARHLARVARRYEKEGRPADFDRLATLVRAHLPSEAAMHEFRLVWFDPYSVWLRRDEAARLAAGEERLEGEWIGAEEVARLNAEHADLENPWVLRDSGLVLWTPLPLRKAFQVLGHAAAYQAHFLKTFGPYWRLVTPSMPLMLVLVEKGTDTEAVRKDLGTDGLVVTYDPGTFRREVQRGLTPLLALSYSRHGRDDAAAFAHHRWCAVGLAERAAYLARGKWGFELRRSARDPRFPEQPGAFLWASRNRDAVPGLDEVLALDDDGLARPENRRGAILLCEFFLTAREGAYRAPFGTLLSRVHEGWASEKSFDSAFKDVDRRMIQRDWLNWLRDLAER